jgi:hypothetical protein
MITLARLMLITKRLHDVGLQEHTTSGEFLTAITMLQSSLLTEIADPGVRAAIAAIVANDDPRERAELLGDLLAIANADTVH